MKIAVASDHRGVNARARTIELLRSLGHDATDFGAECDESVDYPDFAAKVGASVSSGESERGILICGTGIGMSIVANKFDGVRAAPVHDDLTAELSRLHNDLNVLCLSADLISDQAIERIIETWIKTAFEGGRHARRLEKIAKIETENHQKALTEQDVVS